MAVGGEKCTERVEGDLKTVTVTNENPVIPTTMAFSTRFQKVSTVTSDGTEINLYHLPEARPEQVAYLLDAAVEIVETYNRQYGMNYPRITLLIILMQCLSARRENGTVLMTDSFFSTALVFYRRMHYYVLAHEWPIFGGVGRFMILQRKLFSEGLADSLPITLRREISRTGKTFTTYPLAPCTWFFFMSITVPSWTFRDISHGDYISYRRDGWDQPLYTGFVDSNMHVSSTTYYDKGYMVFKMLETYVGRDVMTEALKEFFTLYQRRIATIEDLRAIIEEKSGKSLQRFFADWIYGTEYVDYYIKEVKTTKAGHAGAGEEYLTELRSAKKAKASPRWKWNSSWKAGRK